MNRDPSHEEHSSPEQGAHATRTQSLGNAARCACRCSSSRSLREREQARALLPPAPTLRTVGHQPASPPSAHQAAVPFCASHLRTNAGVLTTASPGGPGRGCRRSARFLGACRERRRVPDQLERLPAPVTSSPTLPLAVRYRAHERAGDRVNESYVMGEQLRRAHSPTSFHRAATVPEQRPVPTLGSYALRFCRLANRLRNWFAGWGSLACAARRPSKSPTDHWSPR